jgi:molecular chaperone DnaJ
LAKRDYYEILGVNKGSGLDEIKTAYRKMAMQYHPDKNPDDHTAEESFKEASEAYGVLSDPDKRRQYDAYGHDGLRNNNYGSYTNVEDIFSAFSDVFAGGIFDEFFGMGGRRSSGRRSTGERGADIKIRLPLSLEEISTGVEKTIKLKRLVKCEECNGSGAKNSSGYSTCHTCQGAGEIRQISRSIFGQMVNISTCPTCSGAGQVIREACHTCSGDGRTQAEDTVKVNIPPGVEQGNYLPVSGKGHAGRRGGSSGDLIVIIEEKEHEFLTRRGDDVIYHLLISYPQAALGAELEVPTLYGNEKLKIESGTQPGTVLSLRDKGIPHLNSYGKGSQIVYVNIFVPRKLDSNEKKTLQQLSESPNISPKKKDSGKPKDLFEKIKDIFS